MVSPVSGGGRAMESMVSVGLDLCGRAMVSTVSAGLDLCGRAMASVGLDLCGRVVVSMVSLASGPGWSVYGVYSVCWFGTGCLGLWCLLGWTWVVEVPVFMVPARLDLGGRATVSMVSGSVWSGYGVYGV